MKIADYVDNMPKEYQDGVDTERKCCKGNEKND